MKLNYDMDKRTNAGFFMFTLGSLELLALTDGYAEISPIQPMFAPNIDPAEIARTLEKNFIDTGKITLAGNILLVKSGDKLILIDTGSGALAPSTGKLTNSLSAAGIRPDNITDIVITHAHPDHIGGVFNAHGDLAFPNATIYISKVEHDFWMADKPDFSKGTLDAVAEFEISFAKKAIDTIKSNLRFFNHNDVLFNCLKLTIAPGHTPGHTVITVFSDGEELVHIADTFQHIILLEHPGWGNTIDSDFHLAVKTRTNISVELSAGRKLVFADHLPWPGLGYIKKIENGYEWVPKVYYTI